MLIPRRRLLRRLIIKVNTNSLWETSFLLIETDLLTTTRPWCILTGFLAVEAVKHLPNRDRRNFPIESRTQHPLAASSEPGPIYIALKHARCCFTANLIRFAECPDNAALSRLQPVFRALRAPIHREDNAPATSDAGKSDDSELASQELLVSLEFPIERARECICLQLVEPGHDEPVRTTNSVILLSCSHCDVCQPS